MPPDHSTPCAHSSYIPENPLNTDLRAEYQHLRAELERLLTAPVKDFLKIDELVGRLELVQLAFKEQHGIKGNNPNE